MYDKELVASRIKQLRIKTDITQEQLGNALGMNKSTIQRYETAGVDKIKEPIIEKMAKILKTSSDYLLGKTDDTSPKSEQNIIFDDFTYAMYDETKELTEEDKEALLNMARILKKKTETSKEKTNKLLEDPKYTQDKKEEFVDFDEKVRYIGSDDTIRYAAYGGGVGSDDNTVKHN